MEPRIQYAKTADGVSIAFFTLGEGYPIAFASSIWGDVHLYKAMTGMQAGMDRLADLGWRLVRYDGRGMGSSGHENADYSFAARVTDLEAVVDHLKLDRFALCGRLHSGPTAVSYTVRHPERVSHLVLHNTFARGKDWYREVPAMRIGAQLRGIAAEQWQLYTLTMANAVTGFADSALAFQLAEAMRTSISGAEAVAYAQATEQIDVKGLLGRVSVPTLVVDDASFLGSTSLTRQIAADIPGAQFVSTGDFAGAVEEFLQEAGEKTATAPQTSAFRTILFTDIVGHTAMMQRLGDAKGRAVLREHERITRDVLKQHVGAEVKTMGDGFMASFSSVTKAIECAIALQRAFAERNESADEPLLVRVGLNAGEPIEEEGPDGRSDLFGATVILAARIAARADGGEVLASVAVRELCAGKGFLFADRGEHVLRGFEDPVRMFEISWQD